MEKISSRSLDDAFSDRLNGLTALRMTLACVILVAHGYPLGGRGHNLIEARFVGGIALADIALASFFIISGFFVTRSALTSSTPRFLFRRVLRIFPGYWACLVFCAFVVAPLAWRIEQGTLEGFFSQPEPAMTFVTANALLGLEQAGVAGVFLNTPYGVLNARSILNGSLWTLPIEFAFYLVVALLSVAGILRRARVLVPIAALGALVWFAALGTTTPPSAHDWYHMPVVGGWYNPVYIARFLFPFMVGATLAVYAPSVALRHWAGWTATVALVLTLFVPTLKAVGGFWIAGQLALAYVVLWIAGSAPHWYRALGWKADYSYGIYIYAFPVQQLLADVGLHLVGHWVFVVVTLAVVIALAMVSWHMIERPMMNLKNLSGRRWSLPLFRRVDPSR